MALRTNPAEALHIELKACDWLPKTRTLVVMCRKITDVDYAPPSQIVIKGKHRTVSFHSENYQMDKAADMYYWIYRPRDAENRDSDIVLRVYDDTGT